MIWDLLGEALQWVAVFFVIALVVDVRVLRRRVDQLERGKGKTTTRQG